MGADDVSDARTRFDLTPEIAGEHLDIVRHNEAEADAGMSLTTQRFRRVLNELDDREDALAILRAENQALRSALRGVVNAYTDETWGTVHAMERALPAARAALKEPAP